MYREEFINGTIKMLKTCECSDFPQGIVGYKLSNEKNNIMSITITTQMLLILEQLFGHNFMFHGSIRKKFNFIHIKNFLLREKEKFLKMEPKTYSDLSVNQCAYCGIGLLLLKEETEAKRLAHLLLRNKVENEYAWGLHLSSTIPDLLATYSVTMLLNRLHEPFERPAFFNELYSHRNENGIPYNMCITEYKYIEALVILTYMDKYYYMYNTNDDDIKTINTHYYNCVESIYEAKETDFKQHPCNQWRVYCFGLAANIVSDLKNPFFEFVLEKLTKYFDKPKTNIPFVLEICRMYNAIIKSKDPFIQDRILQEVVHAQNNVLRLEQYILKLTTTIQDNQRELQFIKKSNADLREYIREITLKMPIATAFVVIYFLSVGFIAYFLSKGFIVKMFNSRDIYPVLEYCIGVAVPIIGFICKKTRKLLINCVDKFYNVFNVVRKNPGKED